ncbi:MAG: cysteine desulfurase [Alphaproteobacteria bacterium]|jgi:cysteine desulfurase|nr:cysteine desulfurase [Alphaproteobacteria bacterium]
MSAVSYLDHNATTPVLPDVVEAIVEALRTVGNPSSVHRFGRNARRLVETAREQVATAVNATAGEVVFTGSGTESNNLALRGIARAPVMVSAIEHDSVAKAVDGVLIAPVDSNGVVDLGAFRLLLEKHRPALVSVMLANNETGVIQPVTEVARIAHGLGALVHCDAVQAFGKIKVDMKALGVDMLSLSAHKIGGPQGAGALVVQSSINLQPLLQGGGQEKRRRAGTENVHGIVGFGIAAAGANDHLLESGRSANLRDAAELRLKALAPAARVFGATADRLPNTLCIEMPDVGAETQVMALDLAGIAVSAGSACSSGKVATSPVLRSMGVEEAIARCAIRISFGRGNTMVDVDRLVQAWGALFARHGARLVRPETAA